MSSDRADHSSAISQRVGAELARLSAKPLAPGLHIVATPIGNLGDITLRALSTLAQADVVYCEDTRHSRTLISHFGLSATTYPYHEHNADQERPRILARLAAGERIALISDAGTPLISDPGYKLAREAIAAGHGVYSIPGPCAAIAALAVAGLPTDCFLFAGFLPARSGQRQARLKEFAAIKATLVLYEAPTRVAETLADVCAVLGDRSCAIARELTKLHEEVRRGTASELMASPDLSALRGEVVIVIGAAVRADVSDDDIAAALDIEMRSASTRDAVRTVAERLGAAKSRVYDLAVSIRRDRH